MLCSLVPERRAALMLPARCRLAHPGATLLRPCRSAAIALREDCTLTSCHVMKPSQMYLRTFAQRLGNQRDLDTALH